MNQLCLSLVAITCFSLSTAFAKQENGNQFDFEGIANIVKTWRDPSSNVPMEEHEQSQLIAAVRLYEVEEQRRLREADTFQKC